jgi:hypothetical protein
MNSEAVRAQATLARVHDFATAEAAFFPPLPQVDKCLPRLVPHWPNWTHT